MMLIEQAIFTSAKTARLDGYQLVAASPGVCEADAREMATWGPSHDSLLETGSDAVSVNFHPLPSGAYCVSKTTPAGTEYSQRRGQLVYSQCLVVPANMLARFANNPFALLTAAFAQGSLRVYDRLPAELEPFRMGGKASAVDQTALGHLLTEPGVTWVGALLEAILRDLPLVLVAGQQRLRLVSGLLNCLPVECRTGVSFSTGLKFSPRRPFKVVCMNGDPAEQRRRFRQYNVQLLELTSMPPVELTASNGWGGFVACAIATGKIPFLAQQLAQPRPGLTLADLHNLGNELLESLASISAAEGDEPAAAPCEPPTGAAPRYDRTPLPAPVDADTNNPSDDNEVAARLFDRAPQADFNEPALPDEVDDEVPWWLADELPTPLPTEPDDASPPEAACDAEYDQEIDFVEINSEPPTVAGGDENQSDWADPLGESLAAGGDTAVASVTDESRCDADPATSTETPAPTAELIPIDLEGEADDLLSATLVEPGWWSNALSDSPNRVEFNTTQPADLQVAAEADPAEFASPLSDDAGSEGANTANDDDHEAAYEQHRHGSDRPTTTGFGQSPSRADGPHPATAARGGPITETLAARHEAVLDDLETLTDEPSQQLAWFRPEALEQLELLDDTVFEAIAGKQQAFEQLARLWPRVLSQVGADMVEESREQYIRYALAKWHDCAADDEQRRPETAIHLMNVLCLLFNRE